MYPYVESVKFLNDRYFNIESHQERFDVTRDLQYPGCAWLNLKSILNAPSHLKANQVYKCRITYGKEIGTVTYKPYVQRAFTQYYLVVCPNDLDYSLKSVNRSFFDEARKMLLPHEDYIYIRNGLITDTSFANLVFTSGESFYTPSEPLLKGTKRSLYLKEGRIKEEEIKVKDLQRFKTFFIINAMLDMEETPVFSCDKLLLSHNHLKL